MPELLVALLAALPTAGGWTVEQHPARRQLTSRGEAARQQRTADACKQASRLRNGGTLVGELSTAVVWHEGIPAKILLNCFIEFASFELTTIVHPFDLDFKQPFE